MDQVESSNAPHTLSPETVCSFFETDPGQGLTDAEARDRLARYGPNEISSGDREGPLSILGRQFESLLVIILVVAAALSLVLWLIQQEEKFPYDTVVIVAIVIANATLGFIQEYRAEQSLEKLKALSGPEATVIREGRRLIVAAQEVVPGDVLAIDTGDSVLADARLVKTVSLETDESTLTGESTPVIKTTGEVEEETPLADRCGMVYAGTAVARGNALAVVTATGDRTEVGKIAELIKAAPQKETPLQKNLDRLGRRLGVVVLAIAAVVSIAGFFVAGPVDLDNALNMLLFGVALAVAAIPEGLPAVVTGALALGTQRMARRRAIVRKLPAVETLGSTTAICSDKTGTLTVGEMTVRKILMPSGTVILSGAGYGPEGEVDGPEKVIVAARQLARSAVLCNNSSVRQDEDGQWRVSGTPTEAALITMAGKLGLAHEKVVDENPRLTEEPFTSESKKMTVLVSEGGRESLHMKGAPEVVLPYCTRMFTEDGMREMTEADRQRFVDAAAGLAREGLRTLAIARRQTDIGDCLDSVTACETGLVFLGLAGISDPPRPEAAAAVEECHRAGIEVYMITGDHLVTAEAIAAEIGIEGGSMTGREIEELSGEELVRRVADVRIFARVSPGHKVNIVEALKELGHTVAMTGDGVNDAPALKRSDIGIAMGISGTDVTREAADMVLADDNFATIVAAIEEGRSIFNNIRKFVTYLLSSNAGEVLTVFLGVLVAGLLGLMEDGRLLLPLFAVQILWINLVTDGLPALALGVDPKDPDAMTRPPRPPGEPVINGRVWSLIALVGAVSCAGTLFVIDAYGPGGFFTMFEGRDVVYARTMAFTVLALFQMYNVFNCRRLRRSSLPHLAGNRWLLPAVMVSLLMMIAVVHLPPLQSAFDTVSLTAGDWLVAAVIASSVLWAVELFKLLTRRRTPADER